MSINTHNTQNKNNMKTLVLKLKEACNDSTLLKANEVILPIVFEENATAIPISLFTINREKGLGLEVIGPAKFYKNYEGDGATLKIEDTKDFGPIYFKPDRVAADGEIGIKIINPHLITHFGNTEKEWSPINKLFRLKTAEEAIHYYLLLKSSNFIFFPNLLETKLQTILVMENEADMNMLSKVECLVNSYSVAVGKDTTFDLCKFGKLSVYHPGSLWSKLGNKMAYIRGDLVNMKGVCKNWYVKYVEDNNALLFSGSTSAADAPVTGDVFIFNLSSYSFESSQLDNLLIAIDNKIIRSNKSGEIKLNGERTSKSDSAVASLKTKTSLYLNGVLQN